MPTGTAEQRTWCHQLDRGFQRDRLPVPFFPGDIFYFQPVLGKDLVIGPALDSDLAVRTYLGSYLDFLIWA